MGKNQSASNLTNIIKQDASGNITFVSGSTTLMTLNTAGVVSGSSPAAYAVTASYADLFTVKGNLTAQTLVVQTITSSVSTITGSTQFGSSSINTHQFTGSVLVSGSLSLTGSTLSSNVVFTQDQTPYFIATSKNGGAIRFRSNAGATTDRSIQLGQVGNDFTFTSLLTVVGDFGGAVGIGTITPAYTLDVSGSGRFTGNTFLGSSGGNVSIGTTSAPSNTAGFTNQVEISGLYPSINLYGSSAAKKWCIGIGAVGSFGIWDNNNSSYALYITSGSNIGIGTTNPVGISSDVKLGVTNGSFIVDTENNGYGGLKIDTDSTGDYNVNIRQGRGGAAGGIRFFTNGRPGGGGAFTGTGNERLTILGTGNVGIGTTSPSAKLHVNGTIIANDFSLAGSYTNTFTTDSSWSGYQTIIPTNTLTAPNVYFIKLWWNAGNSPYVFTTGFLWGCNQSNGSGADLAFTPMLSTHQGTSTSLSVRNLAGTGQVPSGLQVQFNSFASYAGTLYLTAVKLG
jgi:hypothetical protein